MPPLIELLRPAILLLNAGTIIALYILRAFVIRKTPSIEQNCILVCIPFTTLGDTVIASSFIESLLIQKPDHQLYILITKCQYEYFRNDTRVRLIYAPSNIRNKTIILTRILYLIRNAVRLRGIAFKYVFIPRPGWDLYSPLLPILLKSEVVLRHAPQGDPKTRTLTAGISLTPGKPIQGANITTRERDSYFLLLSRSNLSCNPMSPVYVPTHVVEAKSQRFVTIIVGAGDRTRSISLEVVIDLLYKLVVAGSECAVAGGRECYEQLATIKETFQNRVFVDTRNTLDSYYTLGKETQILVGPDSGITHLMAIHAKAVVVVSKHPCDADDFHDNSPKRFEPFNPRVKILRPIKLCTNCTGTCQGRCIDAVTASDILRATQCF